VFPIDVTGKDKRFVAINAQALSNSEPLRRYLAPKTQRARARHGVPRECMLAGRHQKRLRRMRRFGREKCWFDVPKNRSTCCPHNKLLLFKHKQRHCRNHPNVATELVDCAL